MSGDVAIEISLMCRGRAAAPVGTTDWPRVHLDVLLQLCLGWEGPCASLVRVAAVEHWAGCSSGRRRLESC